MPNIATVTIKPPTDGGDLMNNFSLEGVGASNYVEKKNWRREYNTEARREGDIIFAPCSAQNARPDKVNGKTIEQIHFAQAPNGQVVLLAFTKQEIFRWYGGDNGKVYIDTFEAGVYKDDVCEWRNINPKGYLFSEDGHRWEAETVNGITFMNNGVDLPVTYCPWDYRAEPCYELREKNIARVETIMKHNGMILGMDIADIHEEDFEDWMNDGDPYGKYIGRIGRRQWRVLVGVRGDPRRWGATAKATITKGDNTLKFDTPMHLVKGDEITIEGAGDCDSNLTVGISGVLDSKTVVIDKVAVTSIWSRSVWKRMNDQQAPDSTYYDLQEDGSAIVRGMEFDSDKVFIYKDTGIWVGQYTGNADQPYIFKHTYEGRKTIDSRWTLQNVHTDSGNVHVFVGRNAIYATTGGEPQEHPKFMICKDLYFENVIDKEKSFAEKNEVTEEYWLRFDSCDEEINILIYSYRWDAVCYSDYGYTAFKNARSEYEQIDGVSQDLFLAADNRGRILIYAASDCRTPLLNNRRAFFGRGAHINSSVTFTREKINGCILTKASEEFFSPEDEGSYFFVDCGTKKRPEYIFTKIKSVYGPEYIELEEDILIISIQGDIAEDSCIGGTFESFPESVLTDGYESFASRNTAEEDEIDLYGFTPIMGSKDGGGPFKVEVFAAKNPSDNSLDTDKKLFEREIDNPRQNHIPTYFRNNYFQTRISVKDTLYDARFSTKVYQIKRVTGSNRITSGGRQGDKQ